MGVNDQFRFVQIGQKFHGLSVPLRSGHEFTQKVFGRDFFLTFSSVQRIPNLDRGTCQNPEMPLAVETHETQLILTHLSTQHGRILLRKFRHFNFLSITEQPCNQ